MTTKPNATSSQANQDKPKRKRRRTHKTQRQRNRKRNENLKPPTLMNGFLTHGSRKVSTRLSIRTNRRKMVWDLPFERGSKGVFIQLKEESQTPSHFQDFSKPPGAHQGRGDMSQGAWGVQLRQDVGECSSNNQRGQNRTGRETLKR